MLEGCILWCGAVSVSVCVLPRGAVRCEGAGQGGGALCDGVDSSLSLSLSRFTYITK